MRGLLERLRLRGAVRHRWLESWMRDAGVARYKIWGGRPDGMPAFPDGMAPPRFLLDGQKDRSVFDMVTGRGGWYQDLDPAVPRARRGRSHRVPPQAVRAAAGAHRGAAARRRDRQQCYRLRGTDLVRYRREAQRARSLLPSPFLEPLLTA
ncbi:hypothetical protein [Streptomyces sp. NPDC005336]|uniref:hypothetical protein n=1 Tax=Streptomyces sp. NPDC005336 TaxID=3157035 RepID=UPI0033B5AADC